MRRLFYVSLLALAFTSPAIAQDAAKSFPVPAAPVTTAATLPVTTATPPTEGLQNLPALDAKVMEEGEPIRLTPDGPAMITLDRDAGTVIIGNPNHATAVMENPRMIMLMPGQPGATKIMALDRDGKSILNRHVLVGAAKADFMRINRVCAIGGSKTCLPQSTYYCPDKCYETTVNSGGANATAGGAASESPTPVAEVPTENYQEPVE